MAACGKDDETPTTAGPTTTVSAGAEQGREIKVGVVVPKTGALAAFATPFDWVHGQWERPSPAAFSVVTERNTSSRSWSRILSLTAVGVPQ